jgi:hypothetical protein
MTRLGACVLLCGAAAVFTAAEPQAPTVSCTISSDQIAIQATNNSSQPQRCTARCQWVTQSGETGETTCSGDVPQGQTTALCSAPNSTSAVARTVLEHSCEQIQ